MEETDRKRELFELLVYWSSSQLLATDMAGPSESQKPGTHAKISTWVAGAQLLEPSPDACQNVH